LDALVWHQCHLLSGVRESESPSRRPVDAPEIVNVGPAAGRRRVTRRRTWSRAASLDHRAASVQIRHGVCWHGCIPGGATVWGFKFRRCSACTSPGPLRWRRQTATCRREPASLNNRHAVGRMRRVADGDRNAELSNANKSFADHRVTGDPPCSSPRRFLPFGLHQRCPNYISCRGGTDLRSPYALHPWWMPPPGRRRAGGG
jgi:hypothetical protein